MEDKSIKIGTAIGASTVSGNVQGNVSSEVKDSFNTYTQEQKRTLAEAADEIQQLLIQLEKSYPTDTTTGKMTVATEAIKHIDSNPKLHKRVLNALKAGGVQALEQFLNHPAASFVIGALEDWQKTQKN
jgi:chemotaxis response regulator CheB